MGGLPWLKTGSATPSATRPAGGATTPPVPPVINAPAHPVTQDHPLTIVKLTASNVKRLRAVTIAPDGNLVVLSGRNGQGKTTVLDCIEYAIGGKDAICAEPVRRGEDSAEIVCDLGDLVVRRRFVAGGGTSVEVTDKNGLRFPSPQKVLDELYGRLSFDPLAFARQVPKQQMETLRGLLGLDFSESDRRQDALFDERTLVNRELKAAEARLKALPELPNTPATLVSAADLVAEIQRAQARNAEVAKKRDRLTAIEARAKALQAELDALGEEWKRISAEDLATIDTAPLTQRLGEVEQINNRVRQNAQRAEVAREVEAKSARSDELTKQIDAVKASKAERIAAAKMPVPGLGFGESGVTLNGLPLQQASAAEQLRVSVAIGIAMNPRLRVLLIRDASLLDHDSMRLVAEMARDAGAQLWLERVETDDATTVVIEDGQVQEPARG